jgi:HAD superfamily hydrolase (TIGR01549 family)
VIPVFPVYLFDVDGTLVDSAADICGAIQGALLGEGVTHISDAFLRGYIGRHLMDVFCDVFPGASPEFIDKMIEEYRRLYPARQHASTSCYPGVLEALTRLGGRKSTATTKGSANTRIILEKFGLLPYFDHVQGTDGFPAKPAPDVIFKALDVLGARPDDCLFVGDSESDLDAARRAGVKSAAVTYGYGKREDLARWTPDYWITDLRDLVGR